MGRPIEVGTPIGITRRNIAKHEIIRFHYCVFQYQRVLKTVRYVGVQVVLLSTLINSYQRVFLEVILKYGNGDISESSWVFRCSKDNEARDGPLLSKSTTQNLWKLLFSKIMKHISKSVRQVIVKGDYIVMSRSLHERIASLIVFLPNTSSPARMSWGGILEESRVIRE